MFVPLELSRDVHVGLDTVGIGSKGGVLWHEREKGVAALSDGPTLRKRSNAMALSRRELMLYGATGLVSAVFSTGGVAKVQPPLDGGPPLTSKADYIQWMQKNRGEAANFLGQRWDR